MKNVVLRNLIIVCICTFFVSNGVHAKFKLSKIKDGIKNTLNSAIKQTKESFNKLVKKSKKESSQKDHSKDAFFNALENPNEANIKGLNVYERKLENRWEEIDKTILGFVWAHQAYFVKTLGQAFIESKDKARLLLHDEIVKKYTTAKAPLISFAADLQKEGEVIRRLLEELGDIKDKIKEFKDEENRVKLDRILEKLVSFEATVERFSVIVCDLLS